MQRICISLSAYQKDNAQTYTAPIRFTSCPMGTVMGIDGHLSIFFEPSKVYWEGGRLDLLRGNNHVSIVNDRDGSLVFDGTICWNRCPSETSNGLTFWVLPPEAG